MILALYKYVCMYVWTSAGAKARRVFRARVADAEYAMRHFHVFVVTYSLV